MIAQLEIENVDETIDTVFLEADQKGTAANEFETKLSIRIVGQERAVRQTSDLYQVFLAGMNPPNQPVGMLGKATLSLGGSRHVDFSRTIVIMTSNLGAREMSELISGGIGFAPVKVTTNPSASEVDQKISRTAVEAARRKFSPEFMNRI